MLPDLEHDQSAINPFKDPFHKDSFKKLRLRYDKDWFAKRWKWHADVEFKNGNTEGKQAFESDTFEGISAQINSFLQTLE